jgi:hypothetical protein
MIEYAIDLLDAGVLASELPAELMDEFDLTPAQAREIARAAIKRKRREGRNDK